MRRDFANGYLVAEVLARYFPSEISMHSFQNAASTPEKRVNWGLVAKFLGTQGINLTQATMDAVMAQDQAAVEKFLQQLYMCAPPCDQVPLQPRMCCLMLMVDVTLITCCQYAICGG